MASVKPLWECKDLEINCVVKHHALFIQTFAMFGAVVNI